ncbi:MAG: hypothetical protein JWP13_719 [Candidatus Saccharibacteria bacterium]|nr:hypothetical protein [Candidatus Saccharibacteria bacterium]
MAANEYVQAAASQLQSAATAVKMEMDQIRAEFMTYERQVSHDISSKEADVRTNTARAAAEGDSSAIHYYGNQARQLKNEIDGMRKQVEDRRNQMNQDLRDKEGAMNDLMNQSRELQNKAASLK